MAKTKEIAEYGDFQTPTGLAHDVCRLLGKQKLQPAAAVEPTCGLGSFLFASLDQFKTLNLAIGVDVNAEYIDHAEGLRRMRPDADKAKLIVGSFFNIDWAEMFSGLPEPVLIIGNLPWVTNAHLEALGSKNLPEKTNFQGHNGLDAITGKANFDISEWMLIRILETMNGRRGTLAMLCKSAVARKALLHGWKNGIGLGKSAIYRIDADVHFGAAVDAALLVTHFCPTGGDTQARVHRRLKDDGTFTTIGYEDGNLFADLEAYHRCKHLCGDEAMKWRSGVKHDCSKVMEFCREGVKYRNGLGELVDLEDDFMFPMLKSSGVANSKKDVGSRWMLVTQKTVGEETSGVEHRAPKTWAYLQRHAALMNKRGSSIYRNRPSFSIFGVGDYSFAPWKVAISGFYKNLSFLRIGPLGSKPVVLDDTSYFLPCKTAAEADYLHGLLSSEQATAFYNAFVFRDAKRPITPDLLRRLDLRVLAEEQGTQATYDRFFGGARLEAKRGRKRKFVEQAAGLFD
jgi:hypothetical protein